MKFNINHYVKVKFTQIGLNRHKKIWQDLHNHYPHTFINYQPPKVDEQGYTEIQLWSLMEDYGNLCGVGLSVPFETEIIIGEK